MSYLPLDCPSQQFFTLKRDLPLGHGVTPYFSAMNFTWCQIFSKKNPAVVVSTLMSSPTHFPFPIRPLHYLHSPFPRSPLYYLLTFPSPPTSTLLLPPTSRGPGPTPTYSGPAHIPPTSANCFSAQWSRETGGSETAGQRGPASPKVDGRYFEGYGYRS